MFQEVEANTPRDAPQQGELHPEPQAKDFIQYDLIEQMFVRKAMMEKGDGSSGFQIRYVMIYLDVAWPADLSISPTPKGGLGTSSMTQQLMTDLSHAMTRSLVRLWMSTWREDQHHGRHDRVVLKLNKAPTIVMLALAQGIHAASLLVEQLKVKKLRPQPLNLELDILDWPDDEPTQEPACCVLQNLMAASESGFVAFAPDDTYEHTTQRINLSNYKRPVSPCPARVELERLALRMLSLFPRRTGCNRHSYQLHGLHHVLADSIKQELSKRGRALFQVSFAPDGWNERVSGGSLTLEIPGDDRDVAVMHYSIGASGDTEGLLQMLGSLKQRCASHMSLQLRVVLDWAEVTGPGGSDYVEVRRRILDSIAAWAGTTASKVSIELRLLWFPSISDVNNVLRSCLPSPGNSRIQGEPWVRLGRLVLDITDSGHALDELTAWNNDNSANATLSAVVDAEIQRLTFQVQDVVRFELQQPEDADVTHHVVRVKPALDVLEDLLERTLVSSVHMKDCKLEHWEENFEPDDCPKWKRISCKNFSCFCLQRNLLIANFKELVSSNPLIRDSPQAVEPMLAFHLVQCLLPIDTPVEPQVMAMCGCKPPAAGAAGPSADRAQHGQQSLADLPTGSDSGRSVHQGPASSPAAAPEFAQAEEPEKEQGDTAAEESLQQVVAESTQAAVADYNGQLARAMQESVLEQPNPSQCVPKGPLDMESCMRFELNRCGGMLAEAISDSVMHAPKLAKQRQRVWDAGCEIRPHWAKGSLMLVPITEEMFMEAGPHPLEGKHYIYGLPEDEDAINDAMDALSKSLRKKKVKVKAPQAGSSTNAGDKSAVETDSAATAAAGGAGTSVKCQAIDEVDEMTVELVVKGTFLDLRIVRDKGSASAPYDLQSMRGPAPTE
mmetsp:Transcript_53134/g.126774  ORF Transcript_53134/g.126774 Transcript_53134/m.126774 type:complete len:894 (+) Transcript_53134:81-2762(+)